MKVSYSEYKTNTSFHRKKSDPKVIIHVDSKNIFTPNKLYTTEHKIPLKKLFELLFKRYYPPSAIPSLPSLYPVSSLSLALSLSLTAQRAILHPAKRNVNFGDWFHYEVSLFCYRAYPIAFHMFKIIYDHTPKALGFGTYNMNVAHEKNVKQ